MGKAFNEENYVIFKKPNNNTVNQQANNKRNTPLTVYTLGVCQCFNACKYTQIAVQLVYVMEVYYGIFVFQMMWSTFVVRLQIHRK